MDTIIILSSVTLGLQLVACVVALAISRAPSWRRARVVAVLAGTAGLYSVFNLLGALFPGAPMAIAWVSSANLTVAGVHAAAWIWYSFSDDEGHWERVPAALRWTVMVHLAWTFLLSVSTRAIDATHISTVSVSWLDVEFTQPQLTPLASISAAITLGLLMLSFAQQVRQARRGVVGASWNAIGFFVFTACALEEILVASGVLDFIYLAEIGYLAIIAPLVAQFVRRFIEHASRLRVLTQALEEQVHVATEQRDAAREALAAQARFAALGRMAGGVGHEINNPLQVLTLLLEELHENSVQAGDATTKEAVEQAIGASERIARIVDGMRSYARPSETAPQRVSPHAIVREVVTAFPAPAPGGAEIVAELAPVPDIIADRRRVAQAIGHALANASMALAGAMKTGGRIVVRTGTSRDGRAMIEVQDNGPGFPAALVPRLGEPFITSHPAAGSAGMGLFIIRGVADAHGGALECENARSGGAVVRMLLPAAV